MHAKGHGVLRCLPFACITSHHITSHHSCSQLQTCHLLHVFSSPRMHVQMSHPARLAGAQAPHLQSSFQTDGHMTMTHHSESMSGYEMHPHLTSHPRSLSHRPRSLSHPRRALSHCRRPRSRKQLRETSAKRLLSTERTCINTSGSRPFQATRSIQTTRPLAWSWALPGLQWEAIPSTLKLPPSPRPRARAPSGVQVSLKRLLLSVSILTLGLHLIDCKPEEWLVLSSCSDMFSPAQCFIL